MDRSAPYEFVAANADSDTIGGQLLAIASGQDDGYDFIGLHKIFTIFYQGL